MDVVDFVDLEMGGVDFVSGYYALETGGEDEIRYDLIRLRI